MPESAPAVLPPDAAVRLAEFARTCKAAARAVSLYPGRHPAVAASLSRLGQASARLTESGPFRIHVHSDNLLTDDGRMPRVDASVAELAALLHRHSIGAFTLNAGADESSWRTLLLLLARPPEDVRRDGGIARLWATAGGPSLEIQEIDYAEVLRDTRSGVPATIEAIVEAALQGPMQNLDDGSLEALLEIIAEPAKLEQLMKHLERAAARVSVGGGLQPTVFLNLVRGVVEYVSRTAPQRVGAVLEQLGRGARHLSVDAMLSLLADRSRPEAFAGDLNVVSALVEHMSDSSVASFVAESVVAERGASERLAHAFQALVPELDRRRQLLALARDEVAGAEIVQEQEEFSELWQRVERMLTSYSDAIYVSEAYARELSHARTHPVEVERASDDPPERIAEWLTTVSDKALRDLDRDLLVDLLALETDPLRWRDVVDTVVTHVDDLARAGQFDQAWTLVDAAAEQSRRDARRRPHADAALGRVSGGSLVKQMPGYLRTADDRAYDRCRRLCHLIGPSLVVPLAEGLAAEQDPGARQRLREILVGFGPRGAEPVRQLMNAANWEVRRTAAFLLREFGSAGSLKELAPLLTDAEPLVRREAVQGLVMSGNREASAILVRALLGARGSQRHALMADLLRVGDARAAPLFAYVLATLEPHTLPTLYAAAIDTLGTAGGSNAVDGLRAALHRGSWRRPLANQRFRRAAARSLRRIGTAAAMDVLREAAARGRFGVRAAARAELRGSGQP